MASGIFAVLEDIAALMDDVALASKVATEKTAGILGDDLAVNAEKATGFLSSREIPVLWAITKGSLLNKIIIIPIALLLNYFLPIAIKIILVLGGCYLAYEGVEKMIHYFSTKFGKKSHQIEVEKEDNRDEKAKIKDAITTDFILSIEIVIIALGTVLTESLPVQISTVIIVSFLATVGVYGIVALIVRMDDFGFRLIRRSKTSGFLQKVGALFVRALPIVIRILAVVGTIALILVSGGIFVHNIDYFHHLFPVLPDFMKEMILGILIGTIVLTMVTIGKKFLVKNK